MAGLKRQTSNTVAAGDFKQRCLQLMEEVRRRRMPITITKRGVPIAKLCRSRRVIRSPIPSAACVEP